MKPWLGLKGSGCESASGDREGCFRGGRASEVLRKLMKEVLPEFFAPITKTLNNVSHMKHGMKGSGLLVWSGIFPSSYSSWTIET